MLKRKLKEPPPRSAVGSATGMVGLAAFGLSALLMAGSPLGSGVRALILLAATATAMILWEIAVEKTYRNASTGLNLSRPRPLARTLETTKTKLAGLWFTWLVIGLFYFTFRTYAEPAYEGYFLLLGVAVGPLMVLSVPYVFLVDRYMEEPQDALWHMGTWLIGDRHAVDAGKLKEHCRAWTIKAFFLAFMFSILPALAATLMKSPLSAGHWDPVSLAVSAVSALMLVDVCFGTIGYIVTLRPLDAHIRDSNPYILGWVAALVCYPPFSIMAAGNPLDYRAGGEEWSAWFAGNDVLLAVWGTILVALIALYASATVVFGVRFSNLTHRGIITTGPYRWFKHPAYLSKNLFWWLMYLPFLSPQGGIEALRSCMLILLVNVIYLVRARTEERHLMADEDYRRYATWIAEYGLLPRLWRRLRPMPVDRPRQA